MARRKITKKPKELGKPRKKKVSPIITEGVDYIDYKDVALLRRFMSERAKIRSRRVAGNDAQQQREVARAIKNAREMALLPYANRVVTQRRSDKSRRRDDDAPEAGAERPVPRIPPPPPSGDGDGGGRGREDSAVETGAEMAESET